MQVARALVLFESIPITILIGLLSLGVGLVIGDFLYGLSQRLTCGEPVLSTTVRCTECGYAIPYGERAPIVSWVRRGVCPHCGEPVSLANPSCQLLGGLLVTTIVMRYGLTMQALELAAFCCVMMTIGLTSVADYTVRNECVLLGVFIRIVYLLWLYISGGDPLTLLMASLFGAAAMSLPLLVALFLADAMLGRDVTGMGTVKMAALVGLYLGWQQGLIAMAIAFFIGAAVWVLMPVKQLNVEVAGGVGRMPGDEGQPEPTERDLRPSFEEDVAEPIRTIPLAPSIALGCWIVMLVGVAVGTWNAPII